MGELRPPRPLRGAGTCPGRRGRLPQGTARIHLPARPRLLDSVSVPGHRTDLTLSRLREEHSADLTIRNLMEALRLTYDLRARYRVFEFEAAQDGAEACAALFAALSETEGEQVRVLLHGLRERLVAAEHPSGGPA
jgi:hypothetical protein